MLVMTYSTARQNFSSALDRAKKDGGVLITRTDGSLFKLVPQIPTSSPFDGIQTNIKLKKGELSAALDEARNDSENRYF